MNINDIIVYVMTAFSVLGALDKIFGNRFGLGKKFEEGISMIAGLSMAMVGIIAISPVLGDVLEPVVVPVFRALGADPAMFAGCFFGNDGGAVPLAEAMTADVAVADYSGLIVGSMMGVAIVYTIPVSMEMSLPEDKEHVAKGLLAGLITIPVGCFTGGIVAGYPVMMVLRNITPIIILALLIVLGLWKIPGKLIVGFTWFGKLMMGIIMVGLGAGIVEALTGIVVIPGMTPVIDGFIVTAEIAMVLSGAYPLVYVVTKLLDKPISAFGKKIGVNETSVAGLLASLVNNIPVFGMIKDMDARGKVVNIAFTVSAGFALGDHLGFTAGYKPEMILPVVTGKLAGGVTAFVLALWMTRDAGTSKIKRNR